MTEKKITYSLNRIKAAKENNFQLEALLKHYHLNIDLIKFMLSKANSEFTHEGKKIKGIVNEFITEVSVNEKLKGIIPKKNLKILKPWLEKMDDFFKVLKLEESKMIKPLLLETEKIFAVLNISVVKLFVNTRK